jgi:putative SOS response-associated peptidase YedK
MCGKFTAMSSWRQVHAFSQPLTNDGGAGGADEVLTYRVGGPLPVIIFDRETRQRRVVPMRWGFPSAKDWRRPQPIHARSETIDTTAAFAEAFHEGQRGIVVFRTFNEGKDMETPSGRIQTEQWTIDPKDGIPRGFAFVWRSFDIPGQPQPMLACVMATVPASALIAPVTDRMPAILADDDWSIWLGEESAELDEVKSVLKTVEGVNWEMAREKKAPKPARPKKPSPDGPEPGLF